MVMMRFSFRVLCFLVPPPLPVPSFSLALPCKLVAMADALLGLVDLDFLLLLHCMFTKSFWSQKGLFDCPCMRTFVFWPVVGCAAVLLHYEDLDVMPADMLCQGCANSWHVRQPVGGPVSTSVLCTPLKRLARCCQLTFTKWLCHPAEHSVQRKRQNNSFHEP
jgi:hypothetical protein